MIRDAKAWTPALGPALAPAFTRGVGRILRRLDHCLYTDAGVL